MATEGGETVAWYDCASGHLELRQASYRDQALDALAPHLVAISTRASGAPLSSAAPPPLSVADDLAVNRPGDSLLPQLEGAPTWMTRQVMRLWRQNDDRDSWRKGIAGERIVGAKLDRLKRRGWHPLHSIPLPSGADIDHLLIGPGGVFCLNTKYLRNARIWVGDSAVKVNGGRGHPYVRNSRHEGSRTSAVLTRACGFPVKVVPVLVFVSAADITVTESLDDVKVVKDREISRFRRQEGVLGPEEIEFVYAVARDRRTWA
ncbi:nuclease-related domain-containing protein [Streptomyces sp. NPDC002680]|uniref:nuclease-related domain-containing protein n=1 Tax=Streptomyces sp. NPDC002680 TaxID=3364659 RepID=UPI0036B17560